MHRAGQAELSGRYVCRLGAFMAVLGGDQLLVVAMLRDAPLFPATKAGRLREDVVVRVGRGLAPV